MERLFRYSVEHLRPIRLMLIDEEEHIRQVTAYVDRFDDEMIEITVLRPQKKMKLPIGAVLSADFRKGDEGQP